MEIVPAILTKDPLEADVWMRQIRDSKRFNRVQVDFIDGEYAANLTIKPSDCDLIPYLPLKFDAQLMVTENNITEWSLLAKKVGFDRIIPQVESISNPEEFDCLAMDFHSPVKVLMPYLEKLKYVLVMSVEPGFGGQDFVNEAIERVKELVWWREQSKYEYKIGVDGGIENLHLPYLEEWKVDEAIVGVKRALEI